MIELTLNDRHLDAATEEAFDASLDGAMAEPAFDFGRRCRMGQPCACCATAQMLG